jgi:hypothetical protein
LNRLLLLIFSFFLLQNCAIKEVLKLKPVQYNWKKRKQDHKSLGLIAQELQPVIKELVVTNETDGMLNVNYTELIPILIKAIQEQQDIIKSLQSTVGSQQSEMNNQDKNYESLLKRVEQLEAVSNQ